MTTVNIATINREIRSGNLEKALHQSKREFNNTGSPVYYQAAIYCATKLGRSNDIDLIFKTAEKHSRNSISSRCINNEYLGKFWPLLPQSVISRLTEWSSQPVPSESELTALEARLQNAEQRSNFIAAREKCVASRHNDEYIFLQNFDLPFPYSYLTDYRNAELAQPPKNQRPPSSIAFIYPIKNRKSRLNISVNSLNDAYKNHLTHSESPIYARAIISEDISDSMVDQDSFGNFNIDVDHIISDTGVSWTRSGLLNIGIKYAQTELVCFVDSDVIFPSDFFEHLCNHALNKVDLSKHIIAVNMYETHPHTKMEMTHTMGTPYSYMWMLKRKHALAVGGFDEQYIGWGSEDRDFEKRATTFNDLTVVSTSIFSPETHVLHLSHDTRTGIENNNNNRKIYKDVTSNIASKNKKDLVAKTKLEITVKNKISTRGNRSLATAPPQSDHSDTLVIMGNGPSLGEIMNDPAKLDLLRKYDTFGLNAAYRAYEQYDFYPTYFGSFDYRVCDSHARAYTDLVKTQGKIKKYFFAKQDVFEQDCKDHPRFQKINFILAPQGVSRQQELSKDFAHFNDCGSSGTNAIQAGYIMGYRKFILLGVDCNYVEILDGVKDLDGIRYEVTSSINKNPNYWFNSYQQIGDQFHKPNEKSIQLVSWQKLRSFALPADISVSNCSLVSKLSLFDIIPFELRTRYYDNIFLIISCNKYRSRIEALRPHYQRNASKNDLYLFVIGGAEKNHISTDGILNLACGDFYQDLPEKVQSAFAFCANNFDFNRLIKVDDDVLINFQNFYKVTAEMNFDYFGKRTPSRPGITPSSTWHFGKVSEDSEHSDSPFAVEPPPAHWAGGGMYAISRRAANCFTAPFARALSAYHLYEDFMSGDILYRSQISAKWWNSNNAPGQGEWCVTNLHDILEHDLKTISNQGRIQNSISIHCGSYAPYYSVSEEKLASLFALIETVFSRNLMLQDDFCQSKVWDSH